MGKRVKLDFRVITILRLMMRHNKPISKLISEFAEKNLCGEEIGTKPYFCEFIIKSNDIDKVEIINRLDGFLKETINESFEEIVEKYLIEDTELDGELSQEEKNLKTNEVIKEIENLVGAEEFKALAREFVKLAPGIKKNGLGSVFTSRAYLFSINDGEGFSTYLRLMSKLLSCLGIFECKDKESVAETFVPPKNSKERPFERANSLLVKSDNEKGQIVSLDISAWMTSVSDGQFRNFLNGIEGKTGNNILVFRVPYVEKEILQNIRNALNDIITTREISFVPFDNAELVELGKRAAEKYEFTAEDEVWNLFENCINNEKRDGRFYGINTINKIVREMIYSKQVQNASDGTDDTVIKKSEISQMLCFDEDERDGYAMLDEMIGMEKVKERVTEITAQIKESMKNKALGAPCIHMRFIGNPGTGKTTVARAIGKIFKDSGVLRNGNFFEYHSRALCGRYLGETSPKTAAICRDAYGSVLFLDEAYSLYRGDGSRSDYGREAIDTLIAEMENHRSDLVVIMAGYKDEMDVLMQGNEGLESRMPYVIDFPNYTREQLFEIFINMAKKHFECDSTFEEAVKDYFSSLPDSVISSKEFSNARFVRNLFERTWGKAVMRAHVKKQELTVLTKEDFIIASSEKEFGNMMGKKENRSIGFV